MSIIGIGLDGRQLLVMWITDMSIQQYMNFWSVLRASGALVPFSVASVHLCTRKTVTDILDRPLEREWIWIWETSRYSSNKSVSLRHRNRGASSAGSTRGRF
jgi:hypothetical protein